MESMVNVQALNAVFENKKVFITGHTGFKGAWLMATLNSMGANTLGYALEPDYRNGLFDVLQPIQNSRSVIADIRDRKKLAAELLQYQPDFIFHLAAQPLVRRSYEIPAETFEVNVTGTANLLEAATQLNGKCTIVVITTDKVYDNKENGSLFKEEDNLGGYDPYSASKACTEIVANAFRSSFFNPANLSKHHKALATARAGNVIGGGDWSQDRIVPDIVRSLQNKKTIAVRSPAAVRPWQHVLEPVVGYLQLAAHLHQQQHAYSTAYNFGPKPEDHLTVSELVETAIKAWGEGAWKDISDANQPHEAALLKLAITRAQKELSWQPKLQAVDAIRWTLDWYKKPAAQQRDFTFEQINRYLSL